MGLEIDYMTDYVVDHEKRKTPEPLIYKASDVLIAGDERIELSPKVLETPIIPFDQSPMFCFCCNYTYKRNSCQGEINKNY